MILAFKAGALAWNGVANGVTVEDGTCASPSGCTTITMSCENIASAGEANLTVPFQTRITNLPVGPHGEDQVRALVSLTAVIKFDVFAVWRRITEFCGQTGTEAEVVARQVGRHEMGHTFGFSHFNGEAQVMFPNTNCSIEIRGKHGLLARVGLP